MRLTGLWGEKDARGVGDRESAPLPDRRAVFGFLALDLDPGRTRGLSRFVFFHLTHWRDNSQDGRIKRHRLRLITTYKTKLKKDKIVEKI